MRAASDGDMTGYGQLSGRMGIMQGRLLPPVNGRIQCFPADRWREEFALAAKAGLSRIEWIFETWGHDANPIASDEGTKELKALSARHDVRIDSLCADYFMEKPLLRAAPEDLRVRKQTLEWLLARCTSAGIGRVVLPFVDTSGIGTDEELDAVAGTLRDLVDTIRGTGVEIHLETSLDPRKFGRLLNQLPAPFFKVNYDSGNSASLGYDQSEESASYGDRIGSVHVKDRLLMGTTVSLGEGHVDWRALGACLKKVAYSGDLILQVARGEDGDEVDWARHNLAVLPALMGWTTEDRT